MPKKKDSKPNGNSCHMARQLKTGRLSAMITKNRCEAVASQVPVHAFPANLAGFFVKNSCRTIMNDLVTQRWQFNVVKLPLDPPQSLTLGIALPSLEQAAPAVRRFVKYAVTKLTASEQQKSAK